MVSGEMEIACNPLIVKENPPDGTADFMSYNGTGWTLDKNRLIKVCFPQAFPITSATI